MLSQKCSQNTQKFLISTMPEEVKGPVIRQNRYAGSQTSLGRTNYKYRFYALCAFREYAKQREKAENFT
jgi:hypothetical protein